MFAGSWCSAESNSVIGRRIPPIEVAGVTETSQEFGDGGHGPRMMAFFGLD
jgi:hypothetical protein